MLIKVLDLVEEAKARVGLEGSRSSCTSSRNKVPTRLKAGKVGQDVQRAREMFFTLLELQRLKV